MEAENERARSQAAAKLRSITSLVTRLRKGILILTVMLLKRL